MRLMTRLQRVKDEERFIREAEAYKNEILPKATGRAERLKKRSARL